MAPTQMPRDIAEMCERLAGQIIESTDAHTVMLTLELERMDVVAAGVAGAVKAWQKFDPSRGIQPQTYLYLPIQSGIFTYLRGEGSQDRRIESLRPKKDAARDKSQELAAWLEDVYEAAKRMYASAKFKQGRRRHAAPQLVAVAALMQHKGLSCRGCARLLAKREDLRAVLGMKHLPHWTWIGKAAAVLRRNSGFQVATNTPPIGGEVATEAA